MTKLFLILAGIGCLAVTLAGCGHTPSADRPVVHEPTTGVEGDRKKSADKEVPPLKEPETGEPVTLPVLPQPAHALTEADYPWSQLLPRDAIRPIYETEVEFVTAEQAPYTDDELVIGLEINGEAKAYAIGPLNSREMVNDTVGGVPVLVTW